MKVSVVDKVRNFDTRWLADLLLMNKLLDYLSSYVENWLGRTVLNIMPKSSLNEDIVTNISGS